MWLFGYGSLVFRPGFPFEERHPAFVEGWARRWWQASPDHRGTPVAPGRVVTLAAADGACWGMAYRVDQEGWASILAQLDHREKAGYEHHRQALHLRHGPVISDGLLYVAGPNNPNFIGARDPERMAAHIATSHGPSGANADYLLRLASALRDMGAEDAETFDLELRVRRLLDGAG